MENPFELLVTYAEYRQVLVAEIWFDKVHVAQLYQGEKQGKCLELFCVPEQRLVLPLETFQEVLKAANKKVVASYCLMNWLLLTVRYVPVMLSSF
jgi:hypothetical protein